MSISNIFISFTEFQNFNINNILKEQEFSNSNNILITNAKYQNTNQNICVKNIIKKNRKPIYNLQLVETKKIIIDSMKVINKSSEIRVFIPHFYHYFANGFIFKLYKEGISFNICLYPDGMLSFQPFKIGYRTFPKQIAYWLYSRIYGLKYKLFFGSIADPFNLVRTIYTYSIKHTINYSNSRLINISIKQNISENSNIVILGHFNNAMLTDQNIYEIIDIIEDFSLGKPNVKIYYKSHPRFLNIGEDKFYSYLKRRLNLVLLFDSKPLELIVEKYKLRFIFAVASSSLVNIKMIYGNSVKCFAIGTKVYVAEEYYSFYSSLYSCFGVDIIELSA